MVPSLRLPPRASIITPLRPERGHLKKEPLSLAKKVPSCAKQMLVTQPTHLREPGVGGQGRCVWTIPSPILFWDLTSFLQTKGSEPVHGVLLLLFPGNGKRKFCYGLGCTGTYDMGCHVANRTTLMTMTQTDICTLSSYPGTQRVCGY